MATNQNEETRTSIDDLNDRLTGIGQQVQKNSSAIMWACIILAAVVVAVLVYIYAIRQPGIQKANDAIGQADLTAVMGNDSLALKQYQAVADDFGYEAGNRAALNAAIILYQQGKYQEALQYVSRYSSRESVIGAAALSLEGDCYVNLGEYQKALDCFRNAVSKSDNNPYYTPTFLLKEANVYRELKDYKSEAACYRQIIDNYPAYGTQMRLDIEKYLRRAELQAGE